jgi:hypothetical protein
MLVSLATTTAVASAMLVGAAVVSASYTFLESDSVGNLSTGRTVTNSAARVDWLRDRATRPDTYRGQYVGTYVSDRAGRSNYCNYAKVVWERIGASPKIGWPSPSLAIGMTRTSGGCIRSCRQLGKAHPAPIVLKHVNLASRALWKTVLTVCHQIRRDASRVCTTRRVSVGGA